LMDYLIEIAVLVQREIDSRIRCAEHIGTHQLGPVGSCGACGSTE
jgi:hypothetical protein